MLDDLPQSPHERAKMLETILLAAAEGDRTNSHAYSFLRTEMMGDPTLKPLLPDFVRTCRDLNHFWSYIKDIAPRWDPRRKHVRDGFGPLLDYFEGKANTPADVTVSDALQTFDEDGVHAIWIKALARRHNDPEGAITTARTLLETVCKRVLDFAGETYDDKEDLPALYRAISIRLQIAPSQHTEEVFKRILGGATSVVEGLGTLRNKMGDAHGRGGPAVKPSARHAQLAVNLAGAMATFIVETWEARGYGRGGGV